jgi:hypothetical protein
MRMISIGWGLGNNLLGNDDSEGKTDSVAAD